MVPLRVVLERELAAVAHDEGVHLRERSRRPARGGEGSLRNGRPGGQPGGGETRQRTGEYERFHPAMIAIHYDAGVSSTTIALGIALIVVGVAGYFLTGGVSLTALIPAVFGVVLALTGVVARDERKRKHAMHAAVVVALLGFLGSIRGLLQIGAVFDGTAARPAAVVSQSIMAVLTLGYIVMAVQSFVKARASRRAP